MDTHDDKEALLRRWITSECTSDEEEKVIQWLGQETPDTEAVQLIGQWLDREVDVTYLDPEVRASLEKKLALILEREENTPLRSVHRIHFLKTAWIRYAAAIIILIGIGTYIYITNQKEKPSVTQTNPNPVQNDIAPGGNKATLTLADGTKINLDEAKSGTIATEGETKIRKIDNQVIYNSPLTSHLSPVSYNTMSTPRGGQYQLTLPDGTRVWLNAESSITYPTAFTGNERKVTMTGEAYFEVAKDKTKKFIVSVEDKQDIEVLGTHFNVNAYKDETTLSTTLLEGSIRLTPHASRLTNSVLTLKPGQQGQLNNNGLTLATNPDIEQVVAWKNGTFNFNNKSFAEVMRQIERWYDVDVKYEGKTPTMRIGGEMGRDLNLSDVLQALKTIGVKYRIEGRTLKVIS